jgi:hypothetical protein
MTLQPGYPTIPRIFFNADTTEAGRDAIGWYHEKRSTDDRNIGLGPKPRLEFARRGRRRPDVHPLRSTGRCSTASRALFQPSQIGQRLPATRVTLADVRKWTHNGLRSEPPITFLNCGFRGSNFPGLKPLGGWTKVSGTQPSLLHSWLRGGGNHARIHSLGRPYDPRARWRQLLFSSCRALADCVEPFRRCWCASIRTTPCPHCLAALGLAP